MVLKQYRVGARLCKAWATRLDQITKSWTLLDTVGHLQILTVVWLFFIVFLNIFQQRSWLGDWGSFVPSLICILQSKKHKFASTICPQYCIWELSLWSAKAPMIAAIPPVFATLAKPCSCLHFCPANTFYKCTVEFLMAFLASNISTKQE